MAIADIAIIGMVIGLVMTIAGCIMMKSLSDGYGITAIIGVVLLVFGGLILSMPYAGEYADENPIDENQTNAVQSTYTPPTQYNDFKPLDPSNPFAGQRKKSQ